VPRVGDADYTDERLTARANEELANKIGNLVNRTVSMIHRYRDGAPPAGDLQADPASALSAARSEAAGHIDHALEEFDLRRATSAIVRIAEEGNRYIEATRPWELARADNAAELDQVLGELLASCSDLGGHLSPFLPNLAERITAQCRPENGRIPLPSPVFRRLENPA
jgi:methionyl-tRNA synthetase